MSLILFFEGHARLEFNKLMESRTNIILKNINFPKILSFELLCEKKYFDYLIDIDVIYYHKLTKKIIKGDSYFTIFLDPNIKTKIEVKTYDLPKINHERWLLNLYKKKDYNLDKMMKTL